MHCFITFNKSIADIDTPMEFTNPFHYSPNRLTVLAAEQLQSQLGTPKIDAKGKMYGVLVVMNKQKELGFLSAYSGNEKPQSIKTPFVPQVFEITNPEGFFRKGETELNHLNKTIKEKENSPELKQLETDLELLTQENEKTIQAAKQAMVIAKKERKIRRIEVDNAPNKEEVLALLIRESQCERSHFKQLKNECKQRVERVAVLLNSLRQDIKELKQIRKNKSAQLQQQIFDNYLFLNGLGKEKSATAIFYEIDATVPPAGAGDCCAPKLLNYAFQNELTPVAMAEFWWGNSPKKEIRKHGYYYPSCNSKCKPILGHMLKGIKVADSNLRSSKLPIQVLYDDDAIAIINKPAGLLSVPGKEITESVYTQVKNLYPAAEEPLIVHRLDMETSGILLIAKTKSVHKNLQQQFLDKTIQKRYVAILDGIIKEDEGTINLPLRVDLDDRPRQLVCYEHGKPALTKWEVVKRTPSQTRLHFYPITGRTHQLRVHAAHSLGLNTPIIGDELYGLKADRLKLHAEEISFLHPSTSKRMKYKCLAEF